MQLVMEVLIKVIGKIKMLNKERFYTDNLFFEKYSRKRKIKLWLTNDHWLAIRKYLYYLRKCEYFDEVGNRLLAFWYERKKNSLGNKLGFYISPHTLGHNVTIWHHGSIIINGDAKIGNNCIFHGNNCIGNNGKNNKVPIIHNNVEIGFGASVIGDVEIADNVKIGAGAVVTKSCKSKGAILIGIPAKEIKR